MQTDDTLISYNLLKQRIIDRGFCTLCGACEAACPTTALHIEKNQVVRLHDCSQDLDLCPICYELCPHSERLLLRALHFISDAPKKDDALGYYRTVILAQAANPKLHGKSRGGGVAAALIEYGVGKQLFDSTIYSQDKTNNHVNVLTSAEYFEDDVLSSFRTDLFTSSVAKAYGTAVFEYKKRKIAYVGLPCHTLALRKMEAWQHKFSNNLAISIGLFCFGALSYTSLLAYITKKTGIQASEIVNMRLSSDLIVQTADREIRLPISEVEDYLQSSCRTCMDFTAELSDISVGAAYPLENWSMVIIRTKTGEEFFNKAVADGAIVVKPIETEPAVYENLVIASMKKRATALEAAESIEKAYGYLPVLLLRESGALANVKVEDVMVKNIETVPYDMTVGQLLHLMTQKHHIAYPVIGEKGEPLGFITIEDASQISKDEREEILVSQIIHRKPISVHIGETGIDAFKKMSENEVGRVLVVDPADSQKIIGLITKTDLMHGLINQR